MKIHPRRSYHIYILIPTVQVCVPSPFFEWEIEVRWMVWGLVIRGEHKL